MSNWIAITEDYVRMGKTTAFIDAMQSTAATNGDQDPLPKMITDVVTKLRSAVAVGNKVDVDVTKIPNSLEGLALRMILRKIKGYLEYPLSTDEANEAKEDASYINRIIDTPLTFEAPDDPADGSGEMQSATRSPQITTPTRNFDSCSQDGI